jgi:hypothetical protein
MKTLDKIPDKITYKHIQEGRKWSCWELARYGEIVEPQWMHGDIASYEISVEIARNIRANYNHIKGFANVQTEHVYS